jgi:hypothetical protein
LAGFIEWFIIEMHFAVEITSETSLVSEAPWPGFMLSVKVITERSNVKDSKAELHIEAPFAFGKTVPRCDGFRLAFRIERELTVPTRIASGIVPVCFGDSGGSQFFIRDSLTIEQKLSI